MLTDQVPPVVPVVRHDGPSRSLLVAGVVGLSSLPVVVELVLDLFSH